MIIPSSQATARSLHIFGDEKVFTVSELSHAIKVEIEKSFTAIKVRGEVSGLKTHSSGHTYMSIKDEESVINAICWRGTKILFPLEDGMEIIVKGRVTTYHARSQYQFIIEEASAAGEGALLKLLNERRKLFASLGYFDRKQPIPRFPKVMGIVTSKTGAVLHDMQHRLEDRYPFCHVIVWPVNVQGAGSAEKVATAIRGFNFMTDKRPDVLIVARGGGSIEDLWTFNEEVVVRAVFESRIPVISAIGHETDTTLIDYAADLRAPTPTAAIELATPVLADVRNAILDDVLRLGNAISRVVRERLQYVLSLSKCLASSQFSIVAISQKYDDKVERLAAAMEAFIARVSLRIQSRRLPELVSYITAKNQNYDSSSRRFMWLLKSYIEGRIEKTSVLFNRLEQSSFKSILKKGFCFVTSRLGKTIETKEMFEREASNGVILHFSDGSVDL
jgi:exodeoxyribonuclease VII large subunit